VSLPVRLRGAAQVEFDEAAAWYETRQRGLGVRFAAAVNHVLAGLAQQPDQWAEIWPGVREAPVPKWPYFIYYQTHSDHVMVWRYSMPRVIQRCGRLVLCREVCKRRRLYIPGPPWTTCHVPLLANET
jgi:hypothetical protein